MKRIIVLNVFVAYAMMCVLYSCTQEQVQVVSSKNYDSQILQKASMFNDSILNSRIKTRGAGTKTLAALDIIAEDIKGASTWGGVAFKIGCYFGPQTASTAAICAGMVGSVYKSCRAYNSNFKTKSPTQKITRAVSNEVSLTRDNVMRAYVQVREDRIDVSSSPVTHLTKSLSDQDEGIQYFGSMHNLILDNLLNGKLSDEEPQKYFSKEELAILDTEEFKSKFDAVMSEEENLDDDDSTVGILMGLFDQIFKTYPESKDDIEFVTNKYIELVKHSNELSEFDKRLVLSALSVSMASATYWEDYTGLME